MNATSTGVAEGASPLRLRTLGGLDLRGRDGADRSGALARSKPLAVLLHLVLTADRGYQRRDALLALLWPDSDEPRARSSLRQALHRLRRELGDDVLVARGDELGLAPGVVACDAVELEGRLARGDLEGALALYGGELLPGFHVDGAAEFERWLDDRRRALHERARDAARTLAEAARRRGDDAGAVGWGRRAVELAPDDEREVRALMQSLARAGDHAGALRAYEQLAERLRAGHGLAPAAETAALATALREQGGGQAPALHARRVLAAPFENDTGDAALDALGRLVADVVATGIGQLAGVEVASLTATLASARHVAQDSDARGIERARLVAREAGAATVVSGTCYRVGDDVLLQAWIADVATGRTLEALGPTRAPLASPLPAIDALREAACTTLARRMETRIDHVRAAVRAPSLAAHAAYVEGMRHFVDGDWPGALAQLESSAGRDPAYPLPLLVSAIAHWNLGRLAHAERAAERARAIGRGAGPFERGMLDMVLAWLRGDWSAAYDAVRRQAELAPGSIPSCQLAEEARRRNRPREAVRLLSALDPTHGELRGWRFYWVELAQALHMLGEHERELEVARRARALHPEASHAALLEVHALAALGDTATLRARLDDALASPATRAPRPGALLREAAHELRAHGHAPALADALLAEALAWHLDLPAEARATPSVARATARARYEAGDLDGAAAAFSALAGDEPAVTDCGAAHHAHLQAHVDHGSLGAIAVQRGDVAEAARIEALLARERGPFLFGAPHYWRAAMAALRGDAEGAARLLRRAFADGLPHEPFVHFAPQFAAVRDAPAMRTLLAPRG